jgi:hypothetical protein
MTPRQLDGSELFRIGSRELGFDVHDFWSWSVSDLVSNATRGILAEFIVAKACGVDTSQPRDEWAPVDLVTPEGVLIEVKSAAFIQSWYQEKLSAISFGVKKTLKWDPETNRQGSDPERTADVYVFAVLAHKDQETLDPLNLDHWEFHVLPTHVLDSRERSQHSITLPSLRRLSAGPHGFGELRGAVLQAAADQRDRRERTRLNSDLGSSLVL